MQTPKRENGTSKPVLGLSGGFRLLQATRESGIQRLRILMSDGRNVCVAEAVPALHVLNGRWKRPPWHERIVEAHHQAGERHHLLQSEELRGRCCRGNVVVEKLQTFAHLPRTQLGGTL